jgi:hypothetical protein
MHVPGRWVGPDGLMPLDVFLYGYIKDIVYKTLVTSYDELKLRIFAAIETVTQYILQNTSGEIEYRSDIFT